MQDIDKMANADRQPCPYVDSCGLFMELGPNMPGLIERLKGHYCFRNHGVCSRRWVREFLGTERVPKLMMPQQRDWAQRLLLEAGVPYTEFERRCQTSLVRPSRN